MKDHKMEKEFEVHMLNESGKKLAVDLAGKFSDLLVYCKSVGQQGRELSLVGTKLEEACFFAKKSLAIKPENQSIQ
jgi:hypothetical protein